MSVWQEVTDLDEVTVGDTVCLTLKDNVHDVVVTITGPVHDDGYGNEVGDWDIAASMENGGTLTKKVRDWRDAAVIETADGGKMAKRADSGYRWTDIETGTRYYDAEVAQWNPVVVLMEWPKLAE